MRTTWKGAPRKFVPPAPKNLRITAPRWFKPKSKQTPAPTRKDTNDERATEKRNAAGERRDAKS